jgi:hypothetical protein
MTRRPRIGGGAAVGLGALALLVIMWFQVLIGQHVLLGGDVLYLLPPWIGEPAAHPPANSLVSDTVVQDLVWQQVFARDVANGDLPLWNPTVEGGVPFLANDQAAVVSPLNWFALLFTPALGLSLAMILKLLLAGSGMFFYLRRLDASTTAAAAAGVAYATSSFMIDWLAWPLASVAAYMPWIFGFVEAYVVSRRRWALAGLALAVCLQFLAGHAETSFHVGLAAAAYTAIRWATRGASLRTLFGLTASVATGTLLAGIQLVPFVDLLREASLISSRATLGMGYQHLHLSTLSTWIIPNALGNPGIDGGGGHLPNFNESSGYAGVAAFVLSPVGVWWSWSRDRSACIALTVTGLLFAGLVYGVGVSATALLPGFNVTNNQRALVVLCFCVAALAGLGLDGVLKQTALSVKLTPLPLLLAWGLLAALGGMMLVVILRGARVDHYLPYFHTYYIGFWLLAGAISLAAAAGFVVCALSVERRAAAVAGLCSMVLLEGAFYAGTFTPNVPLSDVPPPSAAISWLQAHATGTRIAAIDTTLLPEAADLYGLEDARGYEILTDPRQRAFWAAADPGFNDSRAILTLERPGSSWLASAGVGYVMMPLGQSIPDTATVYQDNSVTIAQVEGPRPFVFSADSVVSASDMHDAITKLASNPMGSIVVEGCCPSAGPADVTVVRRSANEVDLDISAQAAATVVVEQSFQAGWIAKLDGRPARIDAADVLFQSVQVPPGHHSVRLTYAPQSFVVGLETSAVGLLGLLILAFAPFGWLAPKRKRAA